jgi:hypothetical protein
MPFERALKIPDCGTVLKGHDFSRAANATKRTWALAPEGMLLKTTIYPLGLRKEPKLRAAALEGAAALLY